jgi:hypothetical protein
MSVNDLEICPRCGGTGVDPDPDGDRQSQSSASGSLADVLVAPLLDWITWKIIALFFPKLHARCRYCRGAGKIPKEEQG